jgi:hypothetical protein
LRGEPPVSKNASTSARAILTRRLRARVAGSLAASIQLYTVAG